MTFRAADDDQVPEPMLSPNSSPLPKLTRDKHNDAHHVRMIRTQDGGALRTFNGGLAHENGWYTSRKARRVLHWQGAAQYDLLTRAEIEFPVVRVASESVRFEFTRHSKKQIYTVDVELVASDGTVTLIEIKRDERDLTDPEYRAKLAAVREACEEHGIRFRIVFRHQIWDSLVHRRNVTLFCSRRFVTVLPELCPIKQPIYRAIGERAIKTLNDQTTRLLTGRAATLNDARRWGYDAEAQAIVMLDELEAIVNQIVASYNVEPHDGLRNQQPALVFERDVNRFGINDFADVASFARDVMEVRSGSQLSLTGIRAFNLRYHDIQAVPDLLRDLVPIEPHRQRRRDATATVKFRYDSMDISRVHVWNRKTRKHVELMCADEQYSSGMPLWLHEQIEREANK